MDTFINHVDMSAADSKKLKQRPDRVIGLRVTDSMRGHLRRLRSACSLYSSGNLVYPFVVVEAKKADNTDANFGSILRQTAFVVRSCLRLQENLKKEMQGEEETDISHHCIVWSFSTIGEEWRLHAAVLDDEENVVSQ